MEISIAAFGSSKNIKRVTSFQSAVQNIRLIPHVYEKPEESPLLVREAADCDVMFFTGPAPYFFAEQEIKKKGIPAVYVPFDDFMVVLSLYYVRYHLQEHTWKLSIDIPNGEYVYKVLKELEVDDSSIFVKDYRQVIHEEGSSFDTDEIVAFHYKLWQEKKIDLVMTSIAAVHSRLNEMGVRSFQMMVPEKNIRSALEKARSLGELERSKNSQIAVGLLAIDNFDRLAAEYAGREIIVKLHQILLSFGKQVDASIQYLGKDQFIIYGTRGSINFVTNNGREISLLNEIKRKLNITVSLGFGLGNTALVAEQNAQIALYHAKKLSDQAFIVTDEKEVIGPLGSDAQSFQLRTQNARILEVAEKTGISVANISKLVEFLKVRGTGGFISSDLADYMQVSRRSAERILKKMLENNFAEVIGEEQPYQKGRPRSLYKLTFLP